MATNARIFTVGVTTVSSPIHNATTFTPATWSALLASAPHAFGTIDLHLPSSSGANIDYIVTSRDLDSVSRSGLGATCGSRLAEHHGTRKPHFQHVL